MMTAAHALIAQAKERHSVPFRACQCLLIIINLRPIIAKIPKHIS
jgi:hypothetical protein